MTAIPDKIKDVIQHVTIECGSCGDEVNLYDALTKDLGWGYYEVRGVTYWECKPCSEDDDYVDDDEEDE